MSLAAAHAIAQLPAVLHVKQVAGSMLRRSRVARLLTFALPLFTWGTVLAQTGTAVSDPNGPRVIVPSALSPQVFVLNADASISGFATAHADSYALHCNAPSGLASSGAASLTLASDDANNALFQTGSTGTAPAAVGRGVPYSGSKCFDTAALPLGAGAASAALSAVDAAHKYLFVVSNGAPGTPDTITSFSTSSVAYTGSAVSMQQSAQASLATGGAYTSLVVDQDGNHGDAVVTAMRTDSNAGGTWLYNRAFGTVTKILGPGGADLPAINSFIIHNPNDGGGELLVLVNQDGLTADNRTNPPLDTTPFTIIDLGQLHDLIVSNNNPKTVTLPAVTTIASSLGYYAMLGAVYNPGDRRIYALVGGGTSLSNIQRSIVRYDPYNPASPAETVVNDVSVFPLNGAQTTQLAVNAANQTLEILATDSHRLFTAGISDSGASVSELPGPVFSDTNFNPGFLTSNPLLGETYIASTTQVDVITKAPGKKMLADLDMTASEMQTSAGAGSVSLLGKFPDPYEAGLSTTNITITATPQGAGAPFTFATVTASSVTTLARYVSGNFPTPGIYTLVASFPGDSVYAAATSAPVNIAVGQALFATTTTATASFNDTTGAGSAIVNLLGATYVPTGTIKIVSVNSGLTLATYTLVGNGLTNPITIGFTAPPSTTAVTVNYSGDGKNQPSSSGNVTLTRVAKVTPGVTLTGPTTATVGNATHFTVAFTSTTTKVPTGNITIFASSASQSYVQVGTVSASAAFASGGASLSWTPAAPDSYSLYAQFPGDTNYNPITSVQVGSITVSGGVYTFALSAPPTASANASFNVVVNASSGSTATGNITVYAVKLGTTTQINLGTVSATTAANGGATLAATLANGGVYTLTGSYAGDSNYPASASANTPTLNVTSGTSPAVTITPSSATLTAAVGATTAKNFILYNTGGGSLTLSNLGVTGQGFSQLNGCPPSLQSGANCTIAVTFAPSVPGTINGTLSITDNATGSPHTVALTGVALGGVAAASPATVTFIGQTVGTGSFLRPVVTLTNTGSAAFTVQSVTLSTTPDFEITTSQCSSLGSVNAGGSCTVNVEFHPTSTGSKSATLTFLTSASTTPQQVTLTGVGLSGNPATPPNCPDADGDGLCDDWETNGVWVRTSSTSEKFIDLPSMGADPKHKDLFIQVDYMATAYVPKGDHTHKLKLSAMAQEIKAFDVSPVSNPDGATGIHLHIDCGYDCTMDPVKKSLWGTNSKAVEIPEITPFDVVNIGRADNFDWSKFDTSSSSFKSSGRSLIFHHLIMAHDLRATDSTSGISRNGATTAQFVTGASDFIVSLGSWTDDMVGTSLNQSATLMHELGHNLGLQHGGDEGHNYKPNYLSVMNYNIQIDGLIIDGQNGYIDYSRFTLPQLDETRLDEKVGISVTASAFPGSNGFPSADHYGTYFFCLGDDASKVGPQVVNSFTGNVNWNCNQWRAADKTVKPYIDPAPVKTDINIDGVTNEFNNGVLTGLTSYSDWPHLVYTGGAVGGNGVGTAPLTSTPSIEITQEQASLIQPIFGVTVSGLGRVRSAPGSRMTLQYVVRNIGLTDDTYAVTTTMQKGWTINTPAPATVAVPAGASVQVAVSYTVPSGATDGDFDKLALTAVSQAAPQIVDSKETEAYALSSPLPDSLSTDALFFGSQTTGQTGRTQSVVLLNTGTSPLSFGAISATAEFTQANTCGTSLPVGASCTVNVKFTPAATGVRTGTLTIDDGTGTPKSIALNGTGVPPVLPIPAVTLTATPTATSTGQTVTFTVNVASISSAPPTGTVSITDGTTQYAQVTLDASGSGTFTSSTLGAGTYSLYAAYSGDTTYRGSNSAYASLAIAPATPTTVALTSSAAAAATGASVTFTATVGGGSGSSQPSGSVRFLDGSAQIGTGTLNASGVATFTTSTLAAGTHTITAAYAGDSTFAGSTSTALTETVGVFVTTNKLTTSAATVVTGAPVTLTATLTATSGSPSGTVTFLDGTATLGTGTLNGSGVATLTTSSLAIGTHSITAQYAASGNFAGSNSAAVQVVVTAVPDFTVTANPTSLTVNSGTSGTAVFTITPSNGYAGTLSFTCDSVPSAASCSFAPAKLTFTAATQTAQTTTLTILTTQASAMLMPSIPGRRTLAPLSFALSIPLCLLGFGFGRARRGLRTRIHRACLLLLVTVGGVAGLTGCGSSKASTTPAGTYTVAVKVTDGTTTHMVSFPVTVK